MIFVIIGILQQINILPRTCTDVRVTEQWRPLMGAEGNVGQAHGGGEGEGHREPNQPSKQEAPHALPRLRSYGALPIRLVNKYRSKITCKEHMWIAIAIWWWHGQEASEALDDFICFL